MKTSNKILLMFFITATLLITAVHAVIFAKYKNGDYVSFEKISEGRFEEHPLPKVKYVSITGLQRCNIIPAAEPKIKIFKMEGTRFLYKVLNDTLLITGDSLLSQQDFERSRNYQTINVYLPGNESINAWYSGLFINGGADSMLAPSWQINLFNASNLSAGDFNNKKAFFNRLQVNANSSSVTFNDESEINELLIQGTSAMITNQKAGIKNMQTSLDDNSTMVLQGKGANNLKFTTKE